MRTKILLIFCCLASSIMVMRAQDIITKTNGDEIRAKVTEVNIKEVKYKKFENPEGPVYTMSKSDIFMIVYENGDKDMFSRAYHRKYPVAAFLLSALYPGIGQFYNGQVVKGISMSVLATGSLVAFGIGASRSYYYSDITAGSLLAYSGIYIWSLIDAPISAGVINRRHQPLRWNLGKDRKLSVVPNILSDNSTVSKISRQSPAYGLSLKLDF